MSLRFIPEKLFWMKYRKSKMWLVRRRRRFQIFSVRLHQRFVLARAKGSEIEPVSPDSLKGFRLP